MNTITLPHRLTEQSFREFGELALNHVIRVAVSLVGNVLLGQVVHGLIYVSLDQSLKSFGREVITKAHIGRLAVDMARNPTDRGEKTQPESAFGLARIA